MRLIAVRSNRSGSTCLQIVPMFQVVPVSEGRFMLKCIVLQEDVSDLKLVHVCPTPRVHDGQGGV